MGNEIHLDYASQSSSEPIECSIYDLTGKCIQVYNFGNKTKGANDFTLALNHFTPGVYLIELRQGNIKRSNKFIY